MPSYSVAIRTLGTAGDKYKKLLDGISKQRVQPKKVIVVLPETYSKPQDRLGNELFVYCRKSMIEQRLRAIDFADSDFILFCDDDVEFDETFAEKLMEPLENKGYSCSAGPLLNLLPPAGLKGLLISFLGSACVMLVGRKSNYIRLLNTGGWSYNRSIEIDKHLIYNTESLPWACFMVKTDVMKSIRLEDETYIEKNGYAAYDDQTMCGKMVLNGKKICVVSDALYIHNDGRTSTKNLRTEPFYAHARNHYIFWHRFIFSQKKNKVSKIWCRICIAYYIAMNKLYSRIKFRKSLDIFNAICQGFCDAKKYVTESEYKNLNSPRI